MFPFLAEGVTAPGDVQRNARVTNTYAGTVSSLQHSSFFLFHSTDSSSHYTGQVTRQGTMSESVEVECVCAAPGQGSDLDTLTTAQSRLTAVLPPCLAPSKNVPPMRVSPGAAWDESLVDLA